MSLLLAVTNPTSVFRKEYHPVFGDVIVKETPLGGCNPLSLVQAVADAHNHHGNYQNLLILHDVTAVPANSTLRCVFEYLDMGSLDRIVRLAKGPLPEGVLAAISYQILSALHVLREQHRIHRLINPTHILFSSTGIVKLSGFDAVRRVDSTFAAAFTFVGGISPFIAPERVRSSGEHTLLSDVYSFGMCILYAALGRFPIHCDPRAPPAELIAHVLRGINVDDALPSASPELRDFLKECLCPVVDRRHAEELKMHSFISRWCSTELDAWQAVAAFFQTSRIPPYTANPVSGQLE
jgi:serine/threonine protein kinase